MPYDLLPQDEPGNPLPDTPPGFTDSLMKRIEDDQRMRRRRRRTAVALATVFLAGGAWMLAARLVDDGPKQNIAHTQPGRRATPVVKTPPVPQPPAPQDAVKRARPVPRTHSHTLPPAPQDAVKRDTVAVPHTPPSTDTSVAEILPGDVKITLDGKEVTDPVQIAAILKSMHDCSARVSLVRHGKPVSFTVSSGNTGSSPCGAAPPPRQ